MKRHHSRRDGPAGTTKRYALRPMDLGGCQIGGRKDVLVVWLDQTTSKQRSTLKFLVRILGLQLERVQTLGKTVHAYEVIAGTEKAICDLTQQSFCRGWNYAINPTIGEIEVENFDVKQTRCAQPRHEAPKIPLPPLPAPNWLNGAGK